MNGINNKLMYILIIFNLNVIFVYIQEEKIIK